MVAPNVFFLFVFGLIFGSFGNVLIYRLPKAMSVGGRSMCPRCKKMIPLWRNIPLVSFALLRGACADCGKRISFRYPLVEFSGGVLFASVAWVTADLFLQVLLALSLWLLLMIALIDFDVQGIPDALNIPFVAVSFLYAWTAGALDWTAVAIGAGFLGAQWIVSMGAWVGTGDLILIVGIAALVGIWPKMVLCLLLAYAIGAVVAAVLLLSKKKDRTDALAFAPFLALSALITVYWGQWIIARLFWV